MIKNFDILKFIRIISVIIFSITLMSCSGEGEGKETGAAVGENIDEDAIQKQHGECWQGNVIQFSYEVIGSSTIAIYKTISNESIPLMMIAFAMWFAFRMIIHVSSFTEENIGEFWKEIFSQFMLCFVCGMLASTSYLMMTTLNLTVFPIFNALLEFGSEMLSITSDSSTNKYDISFGSLEAMSFKPIKCTPSADAAKYISGDAFPTAPQQMMSCMACSVNERLNIGISIAYKALATFNIVSLITGLFILGGFMIVKLGFVFSLVDSIFRLGIMVVLLPILIMAYAFKATRKWTKEGFLIMLSAGSFMTFISIIISITLMAMETLFSKNSIVFGNMASAEFWNENTFKEFSATFLCLILITFLLVQSIGIAKQMSNSLVGGGADDKFAKKLKAIVESLALFVVGLITAGSSTIATKVFKKAAEEGVKAATEDSDKKM